MKTGWVTEHGYHRQAIGGKRMRYEHQRIAETALGKSLPKGAVVHHADGNKLNNAPDNLVICPSQEYHQLIHRRQRALEICGEVDWNQCWVCKEWGPNDVVVNRGRGNYAHAPCLKRYHWLDKLINRKRKTWATN